MVVTSEKPECGPLTAPQQVWRAVHRIAAEKGMGDAEIGRLRLWAGQRMRHLPFAAFEQEKGNMRHSFLIAIEHAARAIARGEVPE